MSKRHPANIFNGWLFVSAPVAQAAMEAQLRFRDEELKTDRHASGEPAAFTPWAIQQVKAVAAEPAIARQIQERRQQLHTERQRLQDRLAATLAAMQTDTERLDDQLALLDQLTGQHNESSITTDQPE